MITLIPPRVAFVDQNGLLSREAYLFLQQLFVRVGGSSSTITEEASQFFLMDSNPNSLANQEFKGAVDSLFGNVEYPNAQDKHIDFDLEAEVTELRKSVDCLYQILSSHIEPTALIAELNKSKQANIVPGTATGSWAGNVAGQSLAAALATSGLVIDTTTP